MVIAYQNQVFLEGLGDKQPVERIPVMPRQGLNRQDVFQVDRQQPGPRVLIKVDYSLHIFPQSQFTQA